MANEGSPNPSALVVNLNEDVRQPDAAKLHVTAHQFGDSEKALSQTNTVNVTGNATTALVTMAAVPEGIRRRIQGFNGFGDANGRFSLKIAGVQKSARQSSAAEPTVSERYTPPFWAEAGEVVLLEVTNLEGLTYSFTGAIFYWDEVLI